MLHSFLHSEINAKKSIIKASIWQSKGKIWWGERLRVGGEGDDRGQDSRRASLTQWTWVWATPTDGEGQENWHCCSLWGEKSWTWLSNGTKTTREDLPVSSDLTDTIASAMGLTGVFSFFFLLAKLRAYIKKTEQQWEMMLSNCGTEDSWEFLGQQGFQSNKS